MASLEADWRGYRFIVHDREGGYRYVQGYGEKMKGFNFILEPNEGFDAMNEALDVYIAQLG